MSGPVELTDSGPAGPEGRPAGRAVLELLASSRAQVGSIEVRRALPRRAHRTVGAWCFADHMGPAAVTPGQGVDIGPHPHIGLQTVTWLVAGEVLHRDSLGSEVVIHPGQLNLMTAGWGVAHAEEATASYRGDLHGVQLWVAQPDRTRHGPPSFEHHAELPRAEIGEAVATVLVGTFAGASSPARRDTDHVGADLALPRGTTVAPLRRDYEHALLVLSGAVTIGDEAVVPGVLAYLGSARDEISLTAAETTRALLLGGVPFEERPFMWWNFVARDAEEVDLARDQWEAGDPRFGVVESRLGRIGAPVPPWHRPGPVTD